MVEENLHSGHRQRMIEKLLKFPESLTDVEVLEIMLYPCLKQKDTNVLAHKIIRSCGSLKNALSADAEFLLSIEGVGEHISKTIILNGLISRRIAQDKKLPRERFAFSKFKDRLKANFLEATSEHYIFYLLDKNNYIMETISLQSSARDEVAIDMKELSRCLTLLSPAFAVMIHNHFSGDASPSTTDDKTTNKIFELFALYGVRLVDHIIVCQAEIFSYFYSHRPFGDNINN